MSSLRSRRADAQSVLRAAVDPVYEDRPRGEGPAHRTHRFAGGRYEPGRHPSELTVDLHGGEGEAECLVGIPHIDVVEGDLAIRRPGTRCASSSRRVTVSSSSSRIGPTVACPPCQLMPIVAGASRRLGALEDDPPGLDRLDRDVFRPGGMIGNDHRPREMPADQATDGHGQDECGAGEGQCPEPAAPTRRRPSLRRAGARSLLLLRRLARQCPGRGPCRGVGSLAAPGRGGATRSSRRGARPAPCRTRRAWRSRSAGRRRRSAVRSVMSLNRTWVRQFRDGVGRGSRFCTASCISCLASATGRRANRCTRLAVCAGFSTFGEWPAPRTITVSAPGTLAIGGEGRRRVVDLLLGAEDRQQGHSRPPRRGRSSDCSSV